MPAQHGIRRIFNAREYVLGTLLDPAIQLARRGNTFGKHKLLRTLRTCHRFASPARILAATTERTRVRAGIEFRTTKIVIINTEHESWNCQSRFLRKATNYRSRSCRYRANASCQSGMEIPSF